MQIFSRNAKNWLIAANRECAKVFRRDGSRLRFVQAYENPDGGLRNREFQSDRPGVGHGKFATGAQAYSLDGGKDPSKHLERTWARRLTLDWMRAFAKEDVTACTIAAEPRLLGMLRAELGEPVRKDRTSIELVWLTEDWAKTPTAKIERTLRRLTGTTA